jgi:hypothetical protein
MPARRGVLLRNGSIGLAVLTLLGFACGDVSGHEVTERIDDAAVTFGADNPAAALESTPTA